MAEVLNKRLNFLEAIASLEVIISLNHQLTKSLTFLQVNQVNQDNQVNQEHQEHQVHQVHQVDQ